MAPVMCHALGSLQLLPSLVLELVILDFCCMETKKQLRGTCKYLRQLLDSSLMTANLKYKVGCEPGPLICLAKRLRPFTRLHHLTLDCTPGFKNTTIPYPPPSRKSYRLSDWMCGQLLASLPLSLTSLYLQDLPVVDLGLLAQLPHLQRLGVRSLEVDSKVLGRVSWLRSLVWLECKGLRGMEELVEGLCELAPTLRHLVCWDCDGEVPLQHISCLTKLEKLSLDVVEFDAGPSQVSDALACLPHLKELGCSMEDLSSLPPSLTSLTALNFIQEDQCYLNTLIEPLAHLRSLFLDDCWGQISVSHPCVELFTVDDGRKGAEPAAIAVAGLPALRELRVFCSCSSEKDEQVEATVANLQQDPLVKQRGIRVVHYHEVKDLHNAWSISPAGISIAA